MAAVQKPVATVPYSGTRQAGDPAQIGHIPAFSPIAIHLLGIASEEYAGLDEIAKLVRADPGLSVEVLRLANSPLFGACREICGILHAIAMLGLKRLKSMVMTVAIRDFLAPARHGAVFGPCWRHSLAAAFIAERSAARFDEDPDEAYTAGLLHEMGQLALIAAQPAEYERLLRRSAEESREVADLEREHFGIDHRAMGLRLIEQWSLPSGIRRAVDCGGAPDGAGLLIHTSCRLAALLGFRVAGGEPEAFDRARFPELPPGMLEDAEELDGLFADVATRINTIECSLGMF